MRRDRPAFSLYVCQYLSKVALDKYPVPSLVSLADLRRLVRRSERLAHDDAMKVLKVGVEAADAILREAATLGYLNFAIDKSWPVWQRTALGQSLVVNPTTKRMTREQALAKLDTVLARVAAINASPGLIHVAEIRLFGSVARIGTPAEPEDFGDIDLEVEFGPRDLADPAVRQLLDQAIEELPDAPRGFLRYMSPERQALERSERKAKRSLRAGPAVVLAQNDQITLLEAPYRIAYRHQAGCTLVVCPSWAPSNLIEADDERHIRHERPPSGRTEFEPDPFYGQDMPQRTLRAPNTLPATISVTEERTYPLSCLEQTRAAVLTALDHEPDMNDLKSVLALALPGTLPGTEAVLFADAPGTDWYEAVQKFASGITEEWRVGIRLGKWHWNRASVNVSRYFEHDGSFHYVEVDTTDDDRAWITIRPGDYSVSLVRGLLAMRATLEAAAAWSGDAFATPRGALTIDLSIYCGARTDQQAGHHSPDDAVRIGEAATALEAALFAWLGPAERRGAKRVIEFEPSTTRQLRLKVENAAKPSGKNRVAVRTASRALASAIEDAFEGHVWIRASWTD